MKQIIFLLLPLSLACLLLSCSSGTSPETTSPGVSPGTSAHGNSTSLNREQIRAIGLALGPIEKKQLTAALKANGLLTVPNHNKATLTALMGGVIKSILVQTGYNVKKGQVIATIANPAFVRLQEDFLSTSAQLDRSELEYRRQEELQAGNASALKQLQASESELKTLKARKASLEKQLALIGISSAGLNSENIQTEVNIVSPIAGAVSNIAVNIGTFADANTPIAEVIDNSQLHLDLFVYERDLGKLREGQTIHFTLTNNPGREYDAKIYAVSNTFEKNSKAVSVHADVEGDKTGLIDGMNITALVSLENATVDAVPSEAIVSYQGQDFIFIVRTPETAGKEEGPASGHSHAHPASGSPLPADSSLYFERIPVRKGTSDVGYSEVTLLKDIPPGSQIAIKGAFFILAKMTNSADHNH